jgi:C4-dicarboxylate-specific signal transduction histidine kinase
MAADIRLDTQRAADVIRHLRNLLKKSKLELKVIDLTEPVQDAVHFHSALAVTRNTHVSISISPMPLPVKGNKGNAVLLHQVVMSLIVNAMDAMSHLPVDQRKLEIATMRAKGSAEVFVSDTGPGIPPDKLREVFAPLFLHKGGRNGLGIIHRSNDCRGA